MSSPFPAANCDSNEENQVLFLMGDRCSGKSKALEHLLCIWAVGDGLASTVEHFIPA